MSHESELCATQVLKFAILVLGDTQPLQRQDWIPLPVEVFEVQCHQCSDLSFGFLEAGDEERRKVCPCGGPKSRFVFIARSYRLFVKVLSNCLNR